MTRFLFFFVIVSCLLCLPLLGKDSAGQNNTAAVPSQDAAAADTAEASADDASDFDGVTVLPHLYTYIDAPVAEQRIVYTHDDIEKLHVESVPKLLESAGIQTLSYGAYGNQSAPSIRGFTGSTIKVVIDGVCVNSAQNGAFDFTSLNPDTIEKVEIVRGGFTEDVSGEGAAGGVVYITTKKQTLGNNFSAGLSAKTYLSAVTPLDTVSTLFGYSGQFGENTFFKTNLKGTFARNAFPFTAYDGSVKYRGNNQVIDGATDSRLTHYFGGGNSWYIGDTTYDGYKHIPGTETSATPGIQQDYNNRLAAGFSFPAVLNQFKIDGTTAWQSGNQLYDEASDSSTHLLNTVSYTGTAQWYGNSRISQSGGTSINASFLDSTDDGIHTLVSGYVKETTKLYAGSVFSCSVPVALSFSGENIAFVPKLGFRANLQHVSFVLDGYRLCLFPDMNQLYWKDSGSASGNPDLKPEDGWGGEAACSVHDVFVPFSVCVFSNYYFNKIQWQSTGGKWKPVNVASAFYIGCDVNAAVTLFSCITVKGSWEWLYNRLLAEGGTYGKRIMYTPDNVGSFSVTYDKTPVTVTVEVNYTGLRYTDNSNLFYLEPYMLLNAVASVQAGKYVSPYVRVDNILDTDYESVPGYPMPGISLECGVSAKW
jgi:vitamin B12 transporter